MKKLLLLFLVLLLIAPHTYAGMPALNAIKVVLPIALNHQQLQNIGVNFIIDHITSLGLNESELQLFFDEAEFFKKTNTGEVKVSPNYTVRPLIPPLVGFQTTMNLSVGYYVLRHKYIPDFEFELLQMETFVIKINNASNSSKLNAAARVKYPGGETEPETEIEAIKKTFPNDIQREFEMLKSKGFVARVLDDEDYLRFSKKFSIGAPVGDFLVNVDYNLKDSKTRDEIIIDTGDYKVPDACQTLLEDKGYYADYYNFDTETDAQFKKLIGYIENDTIAEQVKSMVSGCGETESEKYRLIINVENPDGSPSSLDIVELRNLSSNPDNFLVTNSSNETVDFGFAGPPAQILRKHLKDTYTIKTSGVFVEWIQTVNLTKDTEITITLRSETVIETSECKPELNYLNLGPKANPRSSLNNADRYIVKGVNPSEFLDVEFEVKKTTSSGKQECPIKQYTVELWKRDPETLPLGDMEEEEKALLKIQVASGQSDTAGETNPITQPKQYDFKFVSNLLVKWNNIDNESLGNALGKAKEVWLRIETCDEKGEDACEGKWLDSKTYKISLTKPVEKNTCDGDPRAKCVAGPTCPLDHTKDTSDPDCNVDGGTICCIPPEPGPDEGCQTIAECKALLDLKFISNVYRNESIASSGTRIIHVSGRISGCESVEELTITPEGPGGMETAVKIPNPVDAFLASAVVNTGHDSVTVSAICHVDGSKKMLEKTVHVVSTTDSISVNLGAADAVTPSNLTELQKFTVAEAKRLGLTPIGGVLGLIKHETAWDPNNHGDKNNKTGEFTSFGLGQLRRATIARCIDSSEVTIKSVTNSSTTEELMEMDSKENLACTLFNLAQNSQTPLTYDCSAKGGPNVIYSGLAAGLRRHSGDSCNLNHEIYPLNYIERASGERYYAWDFVPEVVEDCREAYLAYGCDLGVSERVVTASKIGATVDYYA